LVRRALAVAIISVGAMARADPPPTFPPYPQPGRIHDSPRQNTILLFASLRNSILRGQYAAELTGSTELYFRDWFSTRLTLTIPVNQYSYHGARRWLPVQLSGGGLAHLLGARRIDLFIAVDGGLELNHNATDSAVVQPFIEAGGGVGVHLLSVLCLRVAYAFHLSSAPQTGAPAIDQSHHSVIAGGGLFF
jgi:hypothetical protein